MQKNKVYKYRINRIAVNMAMLFVVLSQPYIAIAQRNTLDYIRIDAKDITSTIKTRIELSDSSTYRTLHSKNTISKTIDIGKGIPTKNYEPIEKITEPDFPKRPPINSEKEIEFYEHLYTNPGNVPTSYTISKNKAVGDITCISSVTDQGASTVNIPIILYNSAHNIQPELSISYNSMGGNGALGYGWSLSGLSVITRGIKSIYYDGTTNSANYNLDDAFYLNGKRLIETKRIDSKIYYQTAFGNTKAIANISNNNVTDFTVLTPDGGRSAFAITDGNTFYISQTSNKEAQFITYKYEKINNHYRIKTITYGSDGEGTITFNYIIRKTDIPINYINGKENSYNYLLGDIITSFNNKTLRKYIVYYMKKGLVYLVSKIDCTNGSEQLNPILFYYGKDNSVQKLTNSQATLSRHFNFDDPNQISICKGQFDYGNDNDGIIQFPNKVGYYQGYKPGSLFHHSKSWTENQFNGDEDILVTTGLNYAYSGSVLLKTEPGFIDIFTANIDKFDGDEIIKINNTKGSTVDTLKFTVFTKNLYAGIAKKYTRNYVLSSLYGDNIIPKYFYCGDFNGDGNNEILVVTSNQYLDNTIGTKVTLLDLESDKILYQGSPFSFNSYMVGARRSSQEAFNTSDKLYTIDYNNDGKTEIAIVKNDATYFYSFNTDSNTSSWYCTSNGSDSKLTNNILCNRRVVAGDFNGDGKFDLMVSPLKGNSYNWLIYAGTGTSKFAKTDITLVSFNDDNLSFYAQDINRDGQTDLIMKNGTTLTTCFISNFTNVGTITTTIEDKCKVIPTSIMAGNSCYSLLLVRNNGTIDKYRINYTDCDNRLLSGVINSLGVINTYKYALLNSDYRDNYSTSYISHEPFKLYNGPLFIVSEEKTLYNNNTLKDVSYKYSNAIIHKQGLGFCGFENVYSFDKVTSRNTEKKFDPYNFGTLITYNTNSFKYIYRYNIKVDANKIAHINLAQKDYEDHTNGVKTCTLYSYDSYDNMISSVVNFGGENYSFLKRSFINIDNDNEYIIGQIASEEQKTERNGQAFKTTIKNSYNDQHLAISTSTYYNDKLACKEDFTYDIKNLVSTDKLTKFSSKKSTISTFTYNTYGQVATRVDGFGFKNVLTYNDKGLLASTTNHLGNIESYSYDGWGNLIKTTHTDNTTIEKFKEWSNGEAGSVFIITTKESGKPIKKIYYDVLGREVRTSEQHFDGKYFAIDKEYDTYNRIARMSYPHSSKADKWISYAYDEHDRITSVKYALKKTETIIYSGLSKTIISDGVLTTKTYNTIGDLVEVSDASGITKYEYDGKGQPTRVLLPDNSNVSVTYDEFGRKIRMTDANAGTSTIEYDDEGNISKTEDARGKTITSTYDSYDRITSQVIDGNETTTFKYDNNGNLTAKICSNGTREDYKYDNLERIIQQKYTIFNNWLSKDISYSDGNVNIVDYTSNNGHITTENYIFRNGVLTTIKLPNNKIIYDVLKEDTYGRVTEAKTGNILNSTSYDNEGRITGLTSKVEDYSIQDFSYKYNEETGNLIYRSDNNRSLSEEFEYDALNRLVTFGDKSISYADNGNITKSSYAGDYTYSIIKPFAVTGITNPNGFISDHEQKLEYNALGRVSRITDERYNITLFYDSEGNRTKMMFSDKTSLKNFDKFYLGGRYEIKQTTSGSTKEFFYVGGDSYSANAVLVRQNKEEWDINFICRDNLGSITTITDEDGNILSEQSYDAWGNLRNIETWNVYTNVEDIPELRLDRGYTGHEHLLVLGLINMNARLYCPMIGRFLNPDPIVQFGDNSQSYNRYSYCLNNPFRGVDFNGKSIIGLIVVGAIIGTFCNVGVKALNGQINSIGDFFKAAGVGALAGAISSAAIAWAGIAGVGILSGMAAGAISGLTGGLITGLGNKMFFGDSYGIRDLIIGTITGAVLGGAAGGVSAKIQGRNIWTGAKKIETPQLGNISEATSQAEQTGNTNVTTENQTIDTNAPANNSSSPISSATEQKVEYEVVHGNKPQQNFSPENKSATFKRPTIKGYADRVKPGSPAGKGWDDLGHNFPQHFDKQIIQYGDIKPIQINGGQTFYLPGRINDTYGWFTITIDQSGTIYHRCFQTNFNAIH